MESISTIGLDIAKSVFQVHAISEAGEIVVRRQLKRRQVLQFFAAMRPCLIGMEACATAHHWARELMKLGHEVRLMPPRYVKPYVKRNKNDAADAEAICEAVTRPTMRFVPVKTVDQQSVLMLHRTRQLFIRQRTTLINSIRAHLAEFGIIAGIGRNGVEALLEVIAKGEDDSIPTEARACLLALAAQLELVKRQNPRDGSARSRLASRQQPQPRPRSDPRCWPAHLDGPSGQHPRPEALPLRSRPQCLDRTGTQAELHRRQGEAGEHQQGRQPLPATVARRRSARRDQARQAARLHPPSMAGSADGAPIGQGRSCCIG